METIRINQENYEISFSAKNEKVHEMTGEEFMEKVLEGYNADFINITDKSSKINTELLSLFLGAEKEGTYKNEQNDFEIKMQKYYDEIKIESIKCGNAFYGEETEDDAFDWNFILSHDIPFLNDELIEDYKKLKKILEITGYESQINISTDKIEIIREEDTVTIASNYKISKYCNWINTFILKNFDTEIKLESKLELPFDNKFRLSVSETGTYLDYDHGIWEYHEVIFFDMKKNVALLDEMENLSETEITELEKLIKAVSENIKAENAKELQKFLNIFKGKWIEYQNSKRKKKAEIIKTELDKILTTDSKKSPSSVSGI